MAWKSLSYCLAVVGLSQSVVHAEEPQKVVRADVKIFTVKDKSFRQLNMPRMFESGCKSFVLDDVAAKKLFEEMNLRTDCQNLGSKTLIAQNGKESDFEIHNSQSFATKVTIQSKNGKVEMKPESEDIDLFTKFKLKPQLVSKTELFFNYDFVRLVLNNVAVPEFPVTIPVIGRRVANAVEEDFKAYITQTVESPKVDEQTFHGGVVLDPGEIQQKSKTILIYVGKSKVDTMNTVKIALLTPVLDDLLTLGFTSQGYEHCILAMTVKLEAMQPIASPVKTASFEKPSEPALLKEFESIAMPKVVQASAKSVETCCKESVVACITSSPNGEILKILLEQYETACKSGDAAKAKTIAAYCMEMDPTCFAKK